MNTELTGNSESHIASANSQSEMSGGLQNTLGRIKEKEKQDKKDKAQKKRNEDKEDARILKELEKAARQEAKQRGEKFDRDAFLTEHAAKAKQSNDAH